MPRVVSLIPSSTEMVCALGCEAMLVARSHECDWPPGVAALPSITEAKLRMEASSAEIDAQVRTLLEQALAIYRVDAGALAALRPDVIITQTQCEVCAVSLRDVEEAVCAMVASRPRIVALSPGSLDDVFADLERVADALGVAERGQRLVATMRARMSAVAARCRAHLGARPAPTVACIEWIEPLMAAGNWMPNLVELAGGRNLFGQAGAHSPWMTLDQLVAADPDVIVVLPCGFDLARTAAELPALAALPAWRGLRAVQGGRVYLADGNRYFNRPGPRVVESLEILAEVLHGPELGYGHEGVGFVGAPIPRPAPSDKVSGARAGAWPVAHARGDVMAQDSIRVSAVLPASASEIYDAWLDGERHGKFTGGTATVEPRVGGRHTAWDGYVEGAILTLEPAKKIVQSWRSLDFPQGAPDSRLEILFADAPGGTEVTLLHTEIPEGQGPDYEEGWVEHYFKPMQRYFGHEPEAAIDGVAAPAPSQPAAPKPRPAAPVKKAAPKAKAAPVKKAAPKAKAKPAPKKAKAKAKAKAAPKKKAKAKAKAKAAPKKKAKAKTAPKKTKKAAKAKAKPVKKKGKKR